MGVSKRADETQTEFAIRAIKEEVYEGGYRDGWRDAKNEAIRLAQQTSLCDVPNPYSDKEEDEGEDEGAGSSEEGAQDTATTEGIALHDYHGPHGFCEVRVAPPGGKTCGLPARSSVHLVHYRRPQVSKNACGSESSQYSSSPSLVSCSPCKARSFQIEWR